ncbi:hypothetical protein PTKIN_Ptkin11bG0004800 [Pterospermum kingtungense]
MAANRPAVVLSIICCFFFLFDPLSSASKITLPSDSSKVSLTLYYESLCPYSANFIVNYLPKLFQDDLISIVDLRLVPWGNAKITGNDTFSCQHGPAECLLNTVEACAIDAWPQLLDLQYAAETNALEPPHRYVPWVVVDGQPLYEDYENYISYVCKAYKGTALPSACSGLSFNQINEKKVIHPVCYKEIPAPTLSSRAVSTLMSWLEKMATSM